MRDESIERPRQRQPGQRLPAATQNQLTRNLAIGLLMAGIPLSVMDNEYFRFALSSLNPRYGGCVRTREARVCRQSACTDDVHGCRLPRADSFTSELDEIFFAVRDELQRRLADVDCISVTNDAATSVAGDELIAVTGHFIDREFDGLHSVVLGVAKVDRTKTVEHLADHMEGLVNDWGGDKRVVAMVTGGCRRERSAKVSCVAGGGTGFLTAVRLGKALEVIDNGVHCAAYIINLW